MSLDFSQFKTLPDSVLASAYAILRGVDWEQYLPEADKAKKMRLILTGYTILHLPMENWYNCIDYLITKQDKK